MNRKMDLSDFGRYNKFYNHCMDILSNIYTRWFGSAFGLQHSDIRRMVDLIADGKTSMTRYKRELNDKIYFDQYGRHLYKDMEGKDVKLYVI